MILYLNTPKNRIGCRCCESRTKDEIISGDIRLSTDHGALRGYPVARGCEAAILTDLLLTVPYLMPRSHWINEIHRAVHYKSNNNINLGRITNELHAVRFNQPSVTRPNGFLPRITRTSPSPMQPIRPLSCPPSLYIPESSLPSPPALLSISLPS